MLRKTVLGLFITLVILFSFLELRNLLWATSYDKATAFGYFIALFYTMILGFLLRKSITSFFANLNKTRSFVVLGLFGAFIVETSIWGAQTVFHITGAAISSKPFVDLIMTLPFYATLTYLFSKIALENENKLSWVTVIILGGIYEIFADGVFGNLFKGDLLAILLSPLLLPVFVIVYAPIILVPYLIIFNPKGKWDEFIFEFKFLEPALAVLVLPVSITLGLILEKVLT